ncbi:MAG: hypothetical protein WCP11_00560 [Candidatus Saccharibacteria bacterium]
MTKQSPKNNTVIISTAIILSVMTLLLPVAAGAANPLQEGVLSAKSPSQPSNLFGIDGIFTTITSTLLFAIGALSVIMIIVGGIRYVVSGGKEANVTKAKNTILYAIIGLVVAMLAYAMISFVLETLIPGANNGGTNV